MASDRDIKIALKARDETGGAFGSVGQKVDGLKRELRGFNDAAQLLRGGGALIGLTAIGTALNNITGELNRVREEAARLDLSGFERMQMSLDAIAARLPVIGQFYQAGKNLSGAFFEASAGVDRITESTKRMETRMSAMQAGAVAFRDAFKRVDDYIQSIERRLMQIGQNPLLTQQQNIGFASQQQTQTLEEQFKAERQRIRDAVSPATQSLQKDVEVARSELKRLEDEITRVRWEPRIGNALTTYEKYQQAIARTRDELDFLQRQITAQESLRDRDLAALGLRFQQADKLQKEAAQREVDQLRSAERERASLLREQWNREAQDRRNAQAREAAMMADARKAEQERAAEASRQAMNAESREREQFMQESSRLETEIAARALDAQGRTVDAQALRIRARADEEIARINQILGTIPLDQTDRRNELERRQQLIRTQRDQEIQAATAADRNAALLANRNAQNTAIVSRFGVAGMGSEGGNPARTMADLQRQQVNKQNDTNKILKDILTLFQSRPDLLQTLSIGGA
jgi:hypothetical protein